jgi:hypothetical protein
MSQTTAAVALLSYAQQVARKSKYFHRRATEIGSAMSRLAACALPIVEAREPAIAQRESIAASK